MDAGKSKMTASQEILSKKELIKQILTDYPETRDSDRECCVKVWRKELPKKFFGETGAAEWSMFGGLYLQGILTSADSISRLKRMIQKECPEFRGIDKSEEQENCREIFIGELNFPNS